MQASVVVLSMSSVIQTCLSIVGLTEMNCTESMLCTSCEVRSDQACCVKFIHGESGDTEVRGMLVAIDLKGRGRVGPGARPFS